MPNRSTADVVYAQSLKRYPEGHAVYAKLSGKDLTPGTCGYFDKKGDWIKLLQITDQADLDKWGFEPFTDVKITKTGGQTRWPLREAANMARFHVGGGGSAS
jgi:hypothetical protein